VSPDLSAYDIRRRLAHGLTIPAISLAGIALTVGGFDSSTMIYMTSPVVAYLVDRRLMQENAGSEP
jgi:hypothetical protein